jgi:hypothetical protein
MGLAVRIEFANVVTVQGLHHIDPRKHCWPARRLGRGEPAGSSQTVFIRFFEPFKHLHVAIVRFGR